MRYLSDVGGNVTDTYTYDAYGIQIASSGSTVNHYRYTGEQWDGDLKMYYLRARYYKPETGRFATMDSFEGTQSDPLSLHKYLYCHANPVNGIDPSGNFIGPSDGLRETQRKLALKKVYGKLPGNGNSWDEYPFASTFEGGTDADVQAAPVSEQARQAVKHRVFYSHHRMKIGDPFFVRVIP